MGASDSSAIVGRWDLTVEDPAGAYPSWVEIEENGGVLTGRFVGRVGSARPLAAIRYEAGRLRFSLPPQYERQKGDLVFIGELTNGMLTGETFSDSGQNVRFTAERAPTLEPSDNVSWGAPIHLLHEQERSNWKLRRPAGPDGWTIKDGLLINTPPSVDLITKRVFRDFKLHVEFNMPPNSNSGVYLRGRYEVQVQDDYGKAPDSRRCGGIYGFITPTKMMARPAGQWNTYDITLVGRRVTVVMNGETIIDGSEIPGITGGALDSREGEPGPVMLQGDHRAIQYRNIILTPAQQP